MSKDPARNLGKVVRMPTGASAFGPFRFESLSGRLFRDDAEIHMTPRASDVLRCLIARRGEIVSKDELFATVWKDVNVTDDALLQVVSAVRKALGDDPRQPEYIQTVTGRGYRFIAEIQDRPAVAHQPASDPAQRPAADHVVPGGQAAAAADADEPSVVAIAGAASMATRRNAAIGLASVALLFVAWGAWSGAFDRWSRNLGGGAERESIAVLPFVNMSDDPANEYFSDGLAEELVSVLGDIEGLRVAARTSSFAFKDRPAEISEIGGRLDVATILEGSARKDGDRVRIVARLVDVADGFELWTATYDRDLDDVFAIQRDIAERVAAALAIPLLGDAAAPLARPPTGNLEAYEAYLQGKYFLARYSVDALRAAARNFERAIELDPDFALAYVKLADAYLVQNRYGAMPLAEALAAAEPAIARAMALDDRLGEAHAMLGLVRERQGDIDAASVAYERAIELDPTSARTYQLYWWMLFLRESNTPRTRDLVQKALDADPLSPAQNENFGWSLFEAGRLDEALAYFNRSVELEPAYPFGHSAIGVYHQTLGQMDQAIESYERAVMLAPENGLFRENLAHAYAEVGRADAAIEQLAAAIDEYPDRGRGYADVGEVYWDLLGQLDRALPWYRQAADRNPDAERLQTQLALLYLDLGDEAAAEQRVDAAVALDPDNRWTGVGRLNLLLYGSRYDEGAAPALRLAENAFFFGNLAQFDRPYSEFAPLGYFGLLAGKPDEAVVFASRIYPGLLDADPVINRFNVNAAIDVAAALLRTGDDGRAEILLQRAMAFIESRPDDLRRAKYREEPAEIFALQGRVPEALAALRGAIDQGWRRGWWRLRHKPHYESLRGEPQFQAMLAELEADAARMRRLVGSIEAGRRDDEQ